MRVSRVYVYGAVLASSYQEENDLVNIQPIKPNTN